MTGFNYIFFSCECAMGMTEAKIPSANNTLNQATPLNWTFNLKRWSTLQHSPLKMHICMLIAAVFDVCDCIKYERPFYIMN